MITVELPRVSMNMVEATVIAWNVSVGAQVNEGDVLCQIETEKVTSEVRAERRGELVEILAQAGAEVQVGAPLCRIRPL
jgi:pyruvate/2-oxoglutarate dehydrogenase complex dihydrolipoamide acyltransferase (E2) component